ncbi:Nitrate/nitrite sensor protein [Candidatus Hydrogenisulfobacillus filiaventi]|uniref:Oxygen sensor histidine kinase NreB n=1 Tax=Candidatus Hydrogenisulfobacillus filiaventi TaxID=2707344 RepID=A0A6F8ZFC3_9FIRM|nr:Nitrate/nitrite sensor protein [Candidatus Hydrogenisulfobacillus filiaventi]
MTGEGGRQMDEEKRERQRYRRLKVITTVGPTLFVAVAETIRYFYLRLVLPPASVSLVAVLVTLVGAAAFSSYVFSEVERIEQERAAYKDAMMALRERERLAREMHDGLAQNLAAINLKVHHLRKLVDAGKLDQAREELPGVQSAVYQSYMEVRQSLYDLNASKRLTEGFWATLKKQAADFSKQTGVLVRVEPLADNQEPWNELTSVQILRIIQEALTNVRKHAQASQVLIEATWQDQEVAIRVADDGRGCSLKEGPDRAYHFGLGIMQERAQSVGGRVEFDSKPGRGTVVTIRLPLGKGGDRGGKSKIVASG